MLDVTLIDISELGRLRRSYASGAAQLATNSPSVDPDLDVSAFGSSDDAIIAANAYAMTRQELSRSSDQLRRLLETRAETIRLISGMYLATEANNVSQSSALKQDL